MNRKLIIGLTGPTGAGKSTAAGILAQLGCDVIDGDVLSREITQPGSPVLAQLAARFGEDILRGDGSLDRGALAARAFADEASRRALGEITHPAITALARERVQASGQKVMVIDAAALLESEIAGLCHRILIITAPEEVRLARILARDGMTEAAARQRITAQREMDYTGYTIIDTTEGEAVLRDALEAVLAEILSSVGGDSAAAGAAAGGVLQA